MNIVLIGYRCSGKTAVGKILAKELQKDFLDTDALIEERAGRSIEEIVSTRGWNRFRKVEKDVVQEVSRNDNVVIATGGGVPIDEENVKKLRGSGWIVWLNATSEVIRQRMVKEQRSGKIRPPLTGDDPLEEIKQLLGERARFYGRAANLVVDTSNLTTKEVAASIIETLPKGL
jgi:shikimate kinase